MPAQNQPVKGNSPDPVENASTRSTPQAEQVNAPVAAGAGDLGRAIAEAMIAANQARITPASATPGMNETRQGGMFIVGGRVVDANGNPIDDAPRDVVAHAKETAGVRAVSQEMEPA